MGFDKRKLNRGLIMKEKKPALALFCAFLFCVLITAGVFILEKVRIKENGLVRANKEVSVLLENETDFNAIIEFIESDTERGHFLGIALINLAKNEERYIPDFETRYPRYKAYRDMVKELAQPDFSDWVAGVINGEVETEFEANVFEYLSGLKDARYLNQAVNRFIKILDDSGDSGFAAGSNKDAFILGAAGFYILQFPNSNNELLKTAIGQKADRFIKLSGSDLVKEIEGIPLNKLYIYLYLKYFSLERLINAKMETFIASGTKSVNAITWNISQVDSLINYFTSIGKGISPNYYSLFQLGFSKDEPIYIYIALQVLSKIGFDDHILQNWLNRNFAGMEDRLSRTYTDFRGRVIKREIVISDEVQETREAIAGKSDIPFEEILEDAIRLSAKDGRFIISRVTPEEEIQKEMRANSAFYTNDFVRRAVTTWELKNQLIAVIAVICLAAAFLCSLAVGFGSKWKWKDSNSLLSWLPLPLAGFILFFVFWNKYDNLSGFQTMPLTAFLFCGGILFIITLKARILNAPSRGLWYFLLAGCGAFNYFVKRHDASQFYYDAAGLPITKQIDKLISGGNLHHALKLLVHYNDPHLARQIIFNNVSFFQNAAPDQLEALFKNQLTWIEYLKLAKRDDLLENIRKETNDAINNPAIENICDDALYSKFVCNFTAFDYEEPNNHAAIETHVSNTLISRWNNGRHNVPRDVCAVIDRANLTINPAVLFVIAQEGITDTYRWAWNKLDQAVQACKTPDTCFAAIQMAADPEKLQRNMNIDVMLKIIEKGFSDCADCIPVFILLMQARNYIERWPDNRSGLAYNRILDNYKNKIKKVQSEIQKLQKPKKSGRTKRQQEEK
jgi:hypothetical protein